MLTNEERLILEQYKDSDPVLRELISKLIQEHSFQISKISHELRNPITLISSYLQLIESNYPYITSIKFWNQITQESKNLCELINDLSTSTKVSSTKLNVVNFSEVILHICQNILIDDRFSSCDFTYDLPENIPLIIANEVKLRQVISNLLNNAREAIIDTNGAIHLSVKDLHNGYIQLEICDNGCGMPEALKSSIFTPFVTSKSEGSGIGLPLIKSIVESHMGKITFKSNEGVGTTFYLDLPCINEQ